MRNRLCCGCWRGGSGAACATTVRSCRTRAGPAYVGPGARGRRSGCCARGCSSGRRVSPSAGNCIATTWRAARRGGPARRGGCIGHPTRMGISESLTGPGCASATGGVACRRGRPLTRCRCSAAAVGRMACRRGGGLAGPGCATAATATCVASWRACGLARPRCAAASFPGRCTLTRPRHPRLLHGTGNAPCPAGYRGEFAHGGT